MALWQHGNMEVKRLVVSYRQCYVAEQKTRKFVWNKNENKNMNSYYNMKIVIELWEDFIDIE